MRQRPKSPQKKQPVPVSVEKDLQSQLENALIREQEKDVEIERLKTTCKSLCAQQMVFEDLHNENLTLRKQLEDTQKLLSDQQAINKQMAD